MPASGRPAEPAVPRLRPARWPDDEAQLAALDTSFETDRVYRVRRDPLAFALVEEPVTPPLRKTYPVLRPDAGRLRGLGHVRVADAGGVLVGLVAAARSTWNRRVEVEDLYVAPAARGRGVGRALLRSAVTYARGVGARCVWLETQTVNYPAVQFYRHLGFRLCGLDESLYEPEGPAEPERREVALFFVLDLPP
jgi:ribosomal protein S18 acetylase RimI-like enzyme